MELNKKQTEAVMHKDGPMMVLAGPGSGKTTVIVLRAKYLIEKYNINPKDITVITFTKAAADEMKSRFNKAADKTACAHVNFGTFHSVFFKIIRNSTGYTTEDILKENERRTLLKRLVQELGTAADDGEELLNNVSNEISLVKNELLDINFYNSPNLSADDFKSIYHGYERIKNDSGKIDFDDMLTKCYLYLREHPRSFKYIMIDEFQDINKVQYECIKLLSKHTNNLFIVGDDDQSIYKFRGARPEFLLKFPTDYKNAKTVVLDTNYRSTDQIIAYCNTIISKNTNRYKKNITGTKKRGKPPTIINPEDITDEAVTISKVVKTHKNYSDCAVIYRTNIQSRAIVDAFMDMNIPFRIRDMAPSIYEHWVCKDVVAYLTLALDKTCKDSFERIINKPKRYINKWFVAEIKKLGGDCLNNLFRQEGLKNWQLLRVEQLMDALDYIKDASAYTAVKHIRYTLGYDSHIKEYASLKNVNPKGLLEVIHEVSEAAKNYEKPEDFLSHIEETVAEMKDVKRTFDTGGVTLTTMHSAKGLEFDTVFITSAVEGVIPHEKSRTEEEIEEERRLFYVAMTRAKKTLHISLPKTKYGEQVDATRFLDV